MTLELDLQHALLLRAPRELPNLRLFVRTVMRARIPSKDQQKPDRVIPLGIKGQSDLWGVFKGGRHIEIELKSAGGRLTPKQRVWQAFCVEWKVPHAVLYGRHDESVDATVDRWLYELRCLLPTA